MIDHLEIHFIELVKYDDKIISMLDSWVNFLEKAEVYSKYDIPLELEEVPTIRKAIELLDNMSLSPEERESYEARLKWLRDEEMGLKKAENKGYVIGKQEGIEEGRELGIEEGRELGIEEGRELGLEEGALKAKIELPKIFWICLMIKLLLKKLA